ncbi:MAG: aldo/keto reductase [Parvibaculum sp.]|uniref:aldo/keto reductase n=1 Tax=Parvibaculum sp. TaxID=2024848 RepID=UPI0025F30420|nr:aldo/keto reductase [Parvibaculum sp.]MCE9648464.1 aldo/keto reductase [Parvibaculum sp.]
MPLRKRRLGRTGLHLTALGFGAAPIGNLYRALTDAEVDALLQSAWDTGLRYFDTAPLYGFGLSEKRLGRFLRTKPRNEFVISTKVGRLLKPNAGWHEQRAAFIDAAPFEPVFDYSHDGVMRSVEESLARLGLDTIDIALMHDIGAATHGADHPAVMKTAMDGGYRALNRLRGDGRLGAIGIGANEWQVCAQAMNHGQWDAFLIAGRYTLLEQEPLDGFFPLCAKAGVGIVIGGAFNSGILATGAVEGAHFNYGDAPPEVVERVRRLDAICKAHGVPLPAAALQFPRAHPLVATVIPGVATASELASALDWSARAIPPALWSDLKSEGLLHPSAPVPA